MNYTFVGSVDDIKNEIHKMNMIEAINAGTGLDELIEEFGWSMTRKYITLYTFQNISNDNETIFHTLKLYKEMEDTYPIDKFPEKWI